MQYEKGNAVLRHRWITAALALTGGMTMAGAAHAQTITTQVFDSVVPFEYDRGRNVSVLQRSRPEFAPIGFRLGSFNLNPSVETSIGYVDNVYQSETAKAADGFVSVAPSARLSSDWALHSLELDAGARLVRFFDETPRNENGWTVGGAGAYDASSTTKLNLAGRTSRLYESQFSGAAVTNVRSAVPVQASIVKGLAEFQLSRLRAALAGDFSDFDYKAVSTVTGTRLSQDSRDRQIARGTAHVEYGVTPDTGVFLQGTYSRIDYRTPLAAGIANRDAKDYRVLVGASFDLSALMRGSLGVGYVHRSYDSPVFQDVKGFSFDARVEYFLSPLTTITVTGRRNVEDASFIGSSGYLATGGSARVDHELLRNLIVNAGVDYEKDDFRGIDGNGELFRVAGGAQYMMSNLVWLNSNVSYGKRDSDGAFTGPRFNEFRAMIGVAIHP